MRIWWSNCVSVPWDFCTRRRGTQQRRGKLNGVRGLCRLKRRVIQKTICDLPSVACQPRSVFFYVYYIFSISDVAQLELFPQNLFCLYRVLQRLVFLLTRAFRGESLQVGGWWHWSCCGMVTNFPLIVSEAGLWDDKKDGKWRPGSWPPATHPL